MSMTIDHKVSALTAHNSLNGTKGAIKKFIRQLSTGLRINNAADDAAGLAISEKMRTQAYGITRAINNAQDGVSLIQTAEEALNETHKILHRIRELSVQASNGTLTQQDRSYIQEEVDQLRDEITRIGNTTQFNKKKLLNGDASVLWSSSDSSTKAIVNGGLRTVDQFGQKEFNEGNYIIRVRTEAGEAQIQKSNILMVKHENVITISGKDGQIMSVSVYNLRPNKEDGNNAEYTVIGNTAAYGITGDTFDKNQRRFRNFIDGSGIPDNASIELALTLTDKINGHAATADSSAVHSTATFHVQAIITKMDGTVSEVSEDITFESDDNGRFSEVQSLSSKGLEKVTLAGAGLGVTNFNRFNELNIGDAAILRTDFSAANANANTDIMLIVSGNGKNEDYRAHQYILTASAIAGNEITLKHFYLDGNGDVQTGSITLGVSNNATIDKLWDSANDDIKTLTSFEVFEVGDTAKGGIRLRDIDKFYNSQGTFLLDEPQTLTLTQGDGKRATVTLYADDSVDDVERKLNDTISNGLGQGKYLDGVGGFVTFVDVGNEACSTPESVAGTFVIRSAVHGATGAISLSGNEDIINALSLNTIQKTTESIYTVNVSDAHTGNDIARDVRVTGNVLHSVVNPNVDVEFDIMAGVTVVWDDAERKFSAKTDLYETLLHLSDNTTVFQIGANQGENIGLNIGDMRAHALGLDSINVMDRESAMRAITISDNAIDRVSHQRTKLGAYRNRLEHTIDNLTVTNKNLTASESRIRDTDMARAMMEFTKLQIMNQSRTSMLAQANQFPQQILSLLR